MESQLPHTQGHHYESKDLSAANPSGLHSGVEGEGHHEKQSVLKKVKAKAKKMKNTLTKHGHDNDHENDHSRKPAEYEDADDDDDDDVDEEMVEDPEIHGAPIYESAAARSAGRTSGDQPGTGIGTNLDKPSMGVPHYDSPYVDPATRPFAQWEADKEQGKDLSKRDKHLAPILPSKLVDTRTGEDIYQQLPHKGINSRTGKDIYDEEEDVDRPRAPTAMEGGHSGVGARGGIDLDPQGPDIRGPPSHVQVKTIEPAGKGSGEAEGIAPVIQSFNKMGIAEEKPKTEQGDKLYTGSHDQFAPEPIRSQSSESVPKSYNAAYHEDAPRDTFNPSSQSGAYRDTLSPSNQGSTNTEKTTSASAADAAYPEDAPSDTFNPSSQSGAYRDTLSPSSQGTEKITSASAANAAYPEDAPSDTFNPSSQSGAYRDTLSPSSQGSTYTEKITSASAAAASAIAGTAQSAKSVVSSKIEQMRDQGEGTNSGSVTGTASDYAHRIAATVTDTLAPVYGKVVGVSNVASTNVSGQESGALGQDKGVSVKEYWAEKLKPGEEDKALSAIITDSFTKPKEEKTHVGSESSTEHKEKTDHAPGDGGGRGISEIVSDAVHKRQPEEGEKERPMGKVTESEEVAKRLGTGEVGTGEVGTGEEGTGVENLGTGGGVVDKLKNVVGSWIGGQGGQTQSAPGTSVAADDEGDVGKDTDAQGVAGERRLQGSSN